MNPINEHKISIVVVNYNVEYFLEQCLNSVKQAIKNISAEVFVVDNNSIDGSVEMVRKKFPEFNLIANKENLGFSKANNQAMRLAKGEYVLLLNPDTVVEEDTFKKVVDFMDANPKSGGLGVKMVDGKGHFLPESKRGLPTPLVAFCKIFGLSKLFPKSKLFSGYHLGFLDENSINKVDILSGAFMLMRKQTLIEVGLLDEAFFMYGEDIDLSYRIIKGGYDNYYYPETSIIHYKGESTKKSSVNYVFVFYKAMIIFAKKHFSQKNASLFSFLIYSAIYLRAGAAIFARFVKKIFLPFVDFSFLLGGLILLTNYWKMKSIEFPDYTFTIALPLYGLVWLISLWLQGQYDKPFLWVNSLKGNIFGTLFILVIYALLPKEFQFSRLFILIGSAWVLIYLLLSRIFLHFALPKGFSLQPVKNKNFAIIGNEEESFRVAEVLKQTVGEINHISFVSPEEIKSPNSQATISQLDQVVFINKIDELVFCAKDCTAQSIIYWMKRLSGDHLDYKIAQPDTLFLIGSNSINTAGDLYLSNINKIDNPKNRRYKRVFDLSFSTLFLAASLLMIWFYSDKKQWLKNMIMVFVGKFSLVGILSKKEDNESLLPIIKYGILHPSDVFVNFDPIQVEKLNLIYVRDYDLIKDWKILKQGIGKLDRFMPF
ncbi:MAG: GT2 family glycosyltransferase [Lentimonas sp.]